MKTFYWDFFGPDAEGTAQHFLEHIDGFIVQNGFVGCTTGLNREGTSHHAVWCRGAPEYEHAIEHTLRPRRIESG
jgi:hypothetical protein